MKLNRDKSNKGRFVQGHLLNQNIGGIGTQDKNIPMTKSLNTGYLKKLENPLKKTKSGFTLKTKTYHTGQNLVPYRIKSKNIADDFTTNEGQNLGKHLQKNGFRMDTKNGKVSYKGYFANTDTRRFTNKKGGYIVKNRCKYSQLD